MKLDPRHVLYLTWQGQAGRLHFPVGRLLELPTAPRYEFSYIGGVRRAGQHGFTSLSGMPDFERVYRTEQLHPFFSNRLMPISRPDWSEHVTHIDLQPNESKPIEILGRGGSRSPTDSFELFSPPTYDERSDTWTYLFPVRGLRHVPHGEEHVAQLTHGMRLHCLLDVQNEFDSNAVALCANGNALIGRVPLYMSDDVSRLLRTNSSATSVRVALINPPPAPVQARLFCVLEATGVHNFEPLASDDYLPVSPGATRLEWTSRRRAV